MTKTNQERTPKGCWGGDEGTGLSYYRGIPDPVPWTFSVLSSPGRRVRAERVSFLRAPPPLPNHLAGLPLLTHELPLPIRSLGMQPFYTLALGSMGQNRAPKDTFRSQADLNQALDSREDLRKGQTERGSEKSKGRPSPLTHHPCHHQEVPCSSCGASSLTIHSCYQPHQPVMALLFVLVIPVL